jgi:hypothetical protein
MTKSEFFEGWDFLCSIFGERDPRTTKAYYGLFLPLDADTWKTAVARASRECKKWPMPADLLDRMPGKVSIEAEADAAWQKVLAALEATDYDPVNGPRPHGRGLDGRILALAGGLGGLSRLYDIQENQRDLSFARREFIDRYSHAQEHVNAGLLFSAEPLVRDIPLLREGADE